MTDQPTGVAHLAARLADNGVRFAAVSPGSRSAPLALALAAEPRIEAVPVIDERSAAFVALGAAKATGIPTVVVCTSGTAAANFAPAVHEAREARVPLIVITADRPPELRGVGEGQTIEQVGLYGRAAPTIELDDPESPADWRSTADLAFAAATAQRPGPAHVNLTLRPPLNAQPPTVPPGPAAAVPGSPAESTALEIVRDALKTASRPVIVAGRDERGSGPGIAAEAARLGIPLLADHLSGAFGPTSVMHWESVIRAIGDEPSTRTDLIIRTGDMPTSKWLRRWLVDRAADGATVIQLDPERSMRDPDGITTHRLEADPVTALQGAGIPVMDGLWLGGWIAASEIASSTIERRFGKGSSISEPSVAATCVGCSRADGIVFVSASMPIRDVESFAPTPQPGVSVMANRGANGIDGVIATAVGASLGASRPVSVLIGDVAFVHDQGSLALLASTGAEVRIVLIDNAGGAIFRSLPIAESGGEQFERFFLTPPHLDAEALAKAWGLASSSPSSLEELQDFLRASPAGSVAVIRTDGADAHSQRRAAHEAVAESLKTSLDGRDG